MSDTKEQGIQAVNQDFVRYDQVNKAHTYHLAENASEAFDEDFQVRVCDMEQFFQGGDAGQAAFAEDLGSAMEEIGFAIITGHGIDPTLHEEMAARIPEVFVDSTLEEKTRFRAKRSGSVSQGYFPIKETSDIHPDMVEGWVWCRRAFDIPQNRNDTFDPAAFWANPDHEPFFRRLIVAHEQLILPLTQSMFRHLGVDPHLYDQRLTNTNFGFRLNYYPAMTAADDASGAGRLLGHEDVDLFTILPAPEVSGLQVWHQGNQKWIRLHAPKGSIIINTGDYMQRITNDRYPSTTHRVGKPTDGSQQTRARVSFPMAVYVWEDEVLGVLPGLGEPRYGPIKAITFHTRSTSKFYGDGYAVEQSVS